MNRFTPPQKKSTFIFYVIPDLDRKQDGSYDFHYVRILLNTAVFYLMEGVTVHVACTVFKIQ